VLLLAAWAGKQVILKFRSATRATDFPTSITDKKRLSLPKDIIRRVRVLRFPALLFSAHLIDCAQIINCMQGTIIY
jgi:hypothetical protein